MNRLERHLTSGLHGWAQDSIRQYPVDEIDHLSDHERLAVGRGPHGTMHPYRNFSESPDNEQSDLGKLERGD